MVSGSVFFQARVPFLLMPPYKTPGVRFQYCCSKIKPKKKIIQINQSVSKVLSLLKTLSGNHVTIWPRCSAYHSFEDDCS